MSSSHTDALPQQPHDSDSASGIDSHLMLTQLHLEKTMGHCALGYLDHKYQQLESQAHQLCEAAPYHRK